MIHSIGDSNLTVPEQSPLQKMTSCDVDNDREDSRIPRSSFSKDSFLIEKRKTITPGPPSGLTPTKKSPKLDLRKTMRRKTPDNRESNSETSAQTCAIAKRPVQRVSFQSDETLVTTADRIPTKAVSFNKRVRIRKIKRLEDIPAEELQATYFSERELVNIRNALRAKIRSLVKQNFKESTYEGNIDCPFDDDETAFCVRGMEHEFPQGKYRRKQHKMMSRGAVLEEQRLQRMFFVDGSSTSTHETAYSAADSLFFVNEDPTVAIAEIYRIESKSAVQQALDFARLDEYVADQIYFAHGAI